MSAGLRGAPPRRGSGFAALAASLAMLAPCAAHAGPPFRTDDPVPTETGHWEIYAPELDASGKGTNYDGSLGVEFNYGLAPNLQLTVGLPVAYAHDSSGFHAGRGDLELAVKYRFYDNQATGVSVAAFPGLSLPTASPGWGNSRVTGLLSIWAQKDAGPWAVFGGGGYAFNPGPGDRDYWTGGVAVTRDVTDRLLVGLEVDRQGPDTAGGRAETSLGVGAILKLKAPFRLLASGGPTFDGEGSPGFRAFLGLGLDF